MVIINYIGWLVIIIVVINKGRYVDNCSMIIDAIGYNGCCGS